MSDKWVVASTENSNQTCAILEFLLEEFCRIFGSDVMMNKLCVVFNDPKSSCPRFNHSTPLSIRLHQSSLTFWSQTIFQLSHEMCHYAMHQTKVNRDITLSWFEEIVCEAASLYALEYASKEWSRCKLSQIDPNFFKEHKDYLDEELSNNFTYEFRNLDSLQKLIEYEVRSQPENNRESHGHERNALYREISSQPLELRCVLDYTQYIKDNGIAIDFDRWIEDNPCNFLMKFREVYPVKLEHQTI